METLFFPYFARNPRFSFFISFLSSLPKFTFLFLCTACYALFIFFFSLPFSFSTSFLFEQRLPRCTMMGSPPPHSFLRHPSKRRMPYTLPWPEVQCAGFYWWGRECSNNDAKEFAAVMQYRTSRCKQPAVILGFLSTGDTFYCESNTQHLCKEVRMSIETSAYASKDG